MKRMFVVAAAALLLAACTSNQTRDGMVIVDKPPSDPKRVFFGAWVSLESEDGTLSRHRIVGPDEFDAAPGYISMDSPLARALMKKGLDDEVTVEVPGGQRTVVIVAIEYETAPSDA